MGSSHFRTIFLVSVLVGCGVWWLLANRDRSHGDEYYTGWSDRQAEGRDLLELYFATADGNLRRQLAERTGLDETEAGRVYRLFSLYCLAESEAVRERAAVELLANPERTLILLLPVLREKDSAALRRKFFRLCVRSAQMAEEPFPADLLRRLTKDADPAIRRAAELGWQEYERENLALVAARYRQSGDYDDLCWLQQQFLAPKEFTYFLPARLEEYFGPPARPPSWVEEADSAWYYPAADRPDSCLKIHYLGDLLVDSEFILRTP